MQFPLAGNFYSIFIAILFYFSIFLFIYFSLIQYIQLGCSSLRSPQYLQKTCSQCSLSPVSEAQLYRSFMSLSLSKILVLASLKVVDTLDMLSSFPEFSVCLSVCSYLCPSFLFTFSWLMFIFSHVFQK